MELRLTGDKYNMNWLREDFAYGEVLCPEAVEASVSSQWAEGVLTTSFRLKNTSDKPLFTGLSEISIRLPLEDRYEDSGTCMTRRCHTHLFCGEDITYAYALRMGGEAPHLGMVVTKGSFGAYSIERDLAKMSNDRGCFLLHPVPMEWLPGEEKKLQWKLFSHSGEEDFYEKAGALRQFVRVEASSYVLFPGEQCRILIKPSFQPDAEQEIRVELLGEEKEQGAFKAVRRASDTWEVLYTAQTHSLPGERSFRIRVGDISTILCIFVQEEPERLAEKRCSFIAERQQYGNGEKTGSVREAAGTLKGLEGAYLIYDNEEEHLHYAARYDDNAGRERVGMGLLIAARLQALKEEAAHRKQVGNRPWAPEEQSWTQEIERLTESFHRYLEFVLRELVEEQTGEVFNDFGRDNSYERLYNSPWYALLMVESYGLLQEQRYLQIACRILKWFYQKGGFEHYTIEMPILSLSQALLEAGLLEEERTMRKLFAEHGDRIVSLGMNYPPSEVNYEQSIVAPAANLLLQCYLLTGEERYLEEGGRQMKVLELFNGHQPDYHCYETAIRHWDGYWFGKNRMYGDTFPHYWSALTGNCFALMYAVTGKEEYAKRGRDSLRGVLPLIFPDGRASCAFLYPLMVNGVKAKGYDPYANDQDWALYFYLRMERDYKKILENSGIEKCY